MPATESTGSHEVRVEGQPLTGVWKRFFTEFEKFLLQKHQDWILSDSAKGGLEKTFERAAQIATEALFFRYISAIVMLLQARLIMQSQNLEPSGQLSELDRLLQADHELGHNGLTHIAGSLPEFELILTSLTAEYSSGILNGNEPTVEEKQLLALGLAEQQWPGVLRESMLPLKTIHKVNHLELASYFGERQLATGFSETGHDFSGR